MRTIAELRKLHRRTRRASLPLLLVSIALLAGAADAGDPRIDDHDSLRRAAETVELDTAFLQAAQQTLPSVAKSLILEGTRGAVDEKRFKEDARRVVYIISPNATGSGALVSGDGNIVTNRHVVGDAREVLVVVRPEAVGNSGGPRAYRGRISKADDVADLAMVIVRDSDVSFPFFALAEDGSLAVGQDVHAIGHPLGADWTYTKGIVSQIREDYEWPDTDGGKHRANVVQTQTPVNPGNSGGPLIDNNGRLVGINAFKAQDAEGINFAVAVNEVRRFLSQSHSTTQPKVASSKGIDCRDNYDTQSRGWANLKACYISRQDPPPDMWVVLKDKAGTRGYYATQARGLIEGVAKGLNKLIAPNDDGKGFTVYFDIDCNGTLDLVGHNTSEAAETPPLVLAPEGLTLAKQAPELSEAITRKLVPANQLQVCGIAGR